MFGFVDAKESVTMKPSVQTVSAVAFSIMLYASAANATSITALDGSQGWATGPVADGGIVDILSTIGAGGNLENNAPLPGGALKLTTSASNASRAEVNLQGDFGRVGDLFDAGLSLTYSWFNEVGSGTTAAPALKLAIFDGSFAGDGFGQLIYEPYAQGNGANTIVIPENQWITETIAFDSGLFWDTGLFGTANQAGGPPYQTLQDYLTDADIDQAGFANAHLVAISIGLGSVNPSVSSFADDVRIGGTLLDADYDFEVAAVPLPAALPLFGTGLFLMGIAGWRRRQRSATA